MLKAFQVRMPGLLPVLVITESASAAQSAFATQYQVNSPDDVTLVDQVVEEILIDGHAVSAGILAAEIVQDENGLIHRNRNEQPKADAPVDPPPPGETGTELTGDAATQAMTQAVNELSTEKPLEDAAKEPAPVAAE